MFTYKEWNYWDRYSKLSSGIKHMVSDRDDVTSKNSGQHSRCAFRKRKNSLLLQSKKQLTFSKGNSTKGKRDIRLESFRPPPPNTFLSTKKKLDALQSTELSRDCHRHRKRQWRSNTLHTKSLPNNCKWLAHTTPNGLYRSERPIKVKFIKYNFITTSLN